MGIAIIPLNVSWVINKIFYLTLCLLFLLQTKKLKLVAHRSSIPLLFLFGYVLFYLLSVATAQPVDLSVGGLISKSVFYPVIFILFCCLPYELDFKKLLFPFFIGTLFVILLSILPLLGYEYTYYAIDELRLSTRLKAIQRSLETVGFARYSGVYINQNTFGIAMLIGFAISIALFYDCAYRKHKYNRIQFYLILFSLIACLLFALITLSRASLLAIGIILFVFSYKSLNSSKGLIAIVFLLTASIVFLYLNQELFDLIYHRFTAQGTSARDLIWNDALDSITKHPFTGVGEFVHIRDNREYTAHNVYLQILADNGVVSGLFWILWVGFYLYSSMRIIFLKSSGENLRMLALAALYVAIIIHQLFESQVNGALNILMFALMLSMTLPYHLYNTEGIKHKQGYSLP